MKTKLLIIIAVFLVLIPWIQALDYDPYNGIRVDGIAISATIAMTLTITFSLVSWFLLSWASKNIKSAGIPLSIITGASLILPFFQVLGPMAAIIIGVVAGLVAFMLQKKMINPTQNKSLKIAAITIGATYFVLTLMIVAIHTPLHVVWDAGDGIGAWTGTPEGMERHVEVLGFSFSVDNIPTENYIGGGSIDLDPDLSPSYAFDFPFAIFYLTILPLTAWFLGISALFLVPRFILKRKKIPSKPYLSLILVGLLLCFGIPSFITSLQTFAIIFSHPDQIPTWVYDYRFVLKLIPIGVLVIAGVLLCRSSLIRKWLKR